MFHFVNSPGVNEPFNTGRAASRLLFDFSIMLACFKENNDNKNVLDFACGTGWVAEFLNRAGDLNVYAFDVSSDVIELAKNRALADKRLNGEKMSFFVSDGHGLSSIQNSFFSNIFCFDSLHHMKDFNKVFLELSRMLIQGGRVIFVEPGAKHSTSKETIEFLEKYKKDDPEWIERDIVLEEINGIAEKNGFNTMRVKPFMFPGMSEFDLGSWLNFRNDEIAKTRYVDELRSFNYDSRVIFYFDKK